MDCTYLTVRCVQSVKFFLLVTRKNIRQNLTETLHQGDNTLSTKHVMLIWAPLIPATRWSFRRQSLLSAGGQLQPHLVAGMLQNHLRGSVTQSLIFANVSQIWLDPVPIHWYGTNGLLWLVAYISQTAQAAFHMGPSWVRLGLIWECCLGGHQYFPACFCHPISTFLP